jgi:hypothetical protein
LRSHDLTQNSVFLSPAIVTPSPVAATPGVKSTAAAATELASSAMAAMSSTSTDTKKHKPNRGAGHDKWYDPNIEHFDDGKRNSATYKVGMWVI